MPAPLTVHIIYNKSNTYGLADDVRVIERLLISLSKSIGQTIQKPKLLDMREPLIHCDIQIHLEIPIYAAIPWAHTNIILVNPEQWVYAYDSYVHAFDALLFRDPVSLERFQTELVQKGISASHLHYLPWCAAWQVKDIQSSYLYEGRGAGFVCFLGASTSKLEYIKEVLPSWKSTDPSLTVYTSRQDFADVLNPLCSDAVQVVCQDLSVLTRHKIMTNYRGHLILSSGEAFGYAAANAEVAGSFAIMNALPAFTSMYRDWTGIAWISNDHQESGKTRYSLARPSATLRQDLESAFTQFKNADMSAIRSSRQQAASKRFDALCTDALPLFRSLQEQVSRLRPSKGVIHCPPLLHVEDCPPISIITPTYNRKRLIEIAFHNLLATDYPQDKIEWIVIEDNEQTPHLVGDLIMNFQLQVPKMKIKYMPIHGKMSIGEKRNCAIREATNDLILFMDDDDHYPPTSFRRRIAWLNKGVKRGKTEQNIVCCTTLALYDLKTGISAVNVPPFDIPFSQRISEATLTFRKSAWEERPFPNVSLAEGENWIEGREDQVLEIPPQQIIVAFSHGQNQSSRRIPPTDQAPSCFWGFPKEYLVFIHDLAGVQIEEDTRAKKR
jgi:hypothetical protein